MSDIFDRIFASAPLNRTAATVTSEGERYTPAKKVTQNHWTAPPRIARTLPSPGPSFTNLTGTRFGRFVVLGLWEPDRPRGKNALPMWVVRCACGDYETRTTRAIRNPANQDDRCQLCRHTAFLQKRSSQQRSVDEFLADQGNARGGRGG